MWLCPANSHVFKCIHQQVVDSEQALRTRGSCRNHINGELDEFTMRSSELEPGKNTKNNTELHRAPRHVVA